MSWRYVTGSGPTRTSPRPWPFTPTAHDGFLPGTEDELDLEVSRPQAGEEDRAGAPLEHGLAGLARLAQRPSPQRGTIARAAGPRGALVADALREAARSRGRSRNAAPCSSSRAVRSVSRHTASTRKASRLP